QGRRTVEHFHVMPSERDCARPRAAGAFSAPGAVLETFERAPNGHGPIEPTQLARDGHGRRAPVGYFGQTRRSERTASEQKAQSLEKVRFALGVGPSENVQLGRRAPGEGAIVTKIT